MRSLPLTSIRPVEPEELADAARLSLQPEVARFTGRDPYAEMTAVVQAFPPLVLGAFDGDTVLACVSLEPSARPRCRHLGVLDLFCRPDAVDAARALLIHAVRTADRWLQLAKLELSVDPEAPWLAAVQAAGLSLEAQRTARRLRAGRRVDDLLHGWVRPGLPVATQALAPVVGGRGPRATVLVRPATSTDAIALQRLHHDPSVVRGTLQTPVRTAATWRSLITSGRSTTLVAVVDGELVGKGGLSRCLRPAADTYALGVAVHSSHQGRGVGTALVGALIAAGRAAGAHRLELGVDVDNPAAQALYRAQGFEVEGTRRARSWRGDGYASTRLMGLVLDA